MEHLLYYGNRRQLTREELARAVRIDPRQIAGLGPSLDALMEMLSQRKEKILKTYQTESVLQKATRRYRELGVDQFTYYASMGLGLKEQKRSLELFITEVMPEFRD